VIHGTSDGIESYVFPVHDNRCLKGSESHDRLVLRPEPITRRLLHRAPTLLAEVGCTCVSFFRGVFIVGHPSCCAAVSFKFVVELQFLLYV